MAPHDSDLVRRQRLLSAALSRMTNLAGLGLTVDVEDSYLLSNAQLCFARGADAGAVFCAHASCERDLAALVGAAGSGPARWERWGLGPLVTHCAEQHGLPTDIARQLVELNESRKTLYHFGHSDSETALRQSTQTLIAEVGSRALRDEFAKIHGHEGGNKDVWRYAMDRALEQKALSSIEAALQLRSWLAECGL